MTAKKETTLEGMNFLDEIKEKLEIIPVKKVTDVLDQVLKD